VPCASKASKGWRKRALRGIASAMHLSVRFFFTLHGNGVVVHAKMGT
jgi:hypothetical protein